MPTTGSSGNPVFQVKTDQPVASLAVNVAWGEEHLPNFLTVLAQEEATATFFVVGDWVEQFPELTQDIAAGGHELGNHSWSHPYPTQIAAEDLAAEIKKQRSCCKSLPANKAAYLHHLTVNGIRKWSSPPVSSATGRSCGLLTPLTGNNRG